ncbi:hypothetical protein RvY_16211 [Ramazzottius varieornatus]|uniref:Reverse transcriptase domain-containing protein n=1 Tax=Ramazzottius varieornatus TaxID=947166 RepID=A0A1D1W464_RAMVA|nr:hypothetical protein RvY_16211 [Ramazzottius varieornatus]
MAPPMRIFMKLVCGRMISLIFPTAPTILVSQLASPVLKDFSHMRPHVFANGEYGEPFRISRGVKQGDPASEELFILYL